MITTGSIRPRVTRGLVDGPRAPAFRAGSRMDPGSRGFVLGTALGVGIASFLAAELMHHVLVPDLGRYQERLLAEALSAFLVSCLVAKLAYIHRRQHRLTMARMQVVAELNHHIRNALTAISLSAYVTENQQLIAVISEGVERIDWALREILPREVPLPEEQRHRLGYFQTNKEQFK